MKEHEGVFDLGEPAATAAHDQSVAEAIDCLRQCEHFVLVADLGDGEMVLAASATTTVLFHAEMQIRKNAVRLLAAEYDDLLESSS